MFREHGHKENNSPIGADMGLTIRVILRCEPATPDPGLFQRVSYSRSMLLNTDDRPNILGVPEAWLDRTNSGVEELCRRMFNWFVANRGYYIIPINIPCTKKGKDRIRLTDPDRCNSACQVADNRTELALDLELTYSTRSTSDIIWQAFFF